MSRKTGTERAQDDAILVNNLTVVDAVHLLRNEGGPMSPGRMAGRAATVLVVAAFTARAIVVGHATAWHLFLPMVAEYLVLLGALPLINLVLRDETLRKDARQSVRLLVWGAALAAGWILFEASQEGRTWAAQAAEQGARLRDWIMGHQMHWPVLGAAVGMAMSLPGRMDAFRRHGPPFVPVGLGCGMRIVVLLLGCFLVPWIAGSSARVTWAIWWLLLLSEAGALVMHWDVQQRLARRGIAL